MSLTATLVALVVAAVVFAGANLMSRRPEEPGRPRLVPYQGIQFAALVVAVLMLAHLVSIVTGTPLTGRMSRW